ncbi:MAG: chalcone isomerase family protein [Pusillimonas sp.]
MRYSSLCLARTVHRLVALAVVAVLALPLQVAAQPAPPEVVSALGSPMLQGQKKFRWFAFTVYDIRLWVPAPASPETLFNTPFALELEYARSLYGKAIAERSLDEMQALATIDETQRVRWLGFMEKAFPDVNQGDRLTGLWTPDGKVTFLLNGNETATVRDARFGELFFGIWLAPGTSEPSMRSALLGLNQ